MGYYNYHKDKEIAKDTEKEVAKILQNTYGAKILEYNKDHEYDIRASIQDIEFTVEVKEDFMCKDTGNVAVEYHCRGKPSGIAVTTADYYIYKVHTKEGIRYLIIPTRELQLAVDKELYHRTVNGGDKGSNTLNYLFDYDTFWELSKLIYQE